MKTFIDQIIKEDFEGALNMLGGKVTNNDHKKIIDFSVDTENQVVLKFYDYVRGEFPDVAVYYSYSSFLYAFIFNYLEEAYLTAYNMALKSCTLTDFKDLCFLESLLFFNQIPEQYLSNTEAKNIVDKILKIDPENKVVSGTVFK